MPTLNGTTLIKCLEVMDFLLRIFWDFFVMAVVMVRLQNGELLNAIVRGLARGTDSISREEINSARDRGSIGAINVETEPPGNAGARFLNFFFFSVAVAVVVATCRGQFSLAFDIDCIGSQEVSVAFEFERDMLRKDRKAFNVRGVDGPRGVVR